MDIQTQLKNDMMAAMKAKDADTLKAIRSLRAAIQTKKLELNKELTEEDVVGVVAKAAKQRKDSISQFRDGGREDLVAEEEKELQVIEKYMPQMMSEEEIEKVVDEVIAATGASSMRDMGKVMGGIMPKVKGKADGGLVNAVVRRKLS